MWVDMPIHSEAKHRYGKLGKGSVRDTNMTIHHKLTLFYTFNSRKYMIETLHLFENTYKLYFHKDILSPCVLLSKAHISVH